MQSMHESVNNFAKNWLKQQFGLDFNFLFVVKNLVPLHDVNVK